MFAFPKKFIIYKETCYNFYKSFNKQGSFYPAIDNSKKQICTKLQVVALNSVKVIYI